MRINELTLGAKDLRSLFEFYGGDLGLSVVSRTADLLALQAGATRLRFRKTDERSYYHFAFNVHPSRFERARAAMAALTPLLHDADGEEVFDFRSWNARASYFYDPAGNIVELIGRRDLLDMPLPPDPGWMSVSEIGVVTDDVPGLTARIGRELGLPVYRESAGETFAALGDAAGLLILVQRGRAWYPDTGTPAISVPLSIELQTGEARWQVQGPPYQFSRVDADTIPAK